MSQCLARKQGWLPRIGEMAASPVLHCTVRAHRPSAASSYVALELGEDKLYGHIKPRKNRARFLEFCRYLRTLYPPEVRIAIICDNFSPHLATRKDKRVGQWAAASNTEIAYTPTNSSWLNRIEAQFTALRYFALDGTDHRSHEEQNSMIRRYIIWCNNHAYNERLRRIVDRAMPCADSSTICARRQVTTDPLPRRMIRTRRCPSSSSISRTRSRSVTSQSRRRT